MFDIIQQSLPVLPLRDTVVFPHAVLPLAVGRESSLQLIHSLGENRTIVTVAQRDARVEAPEPSDLYAVGTLGVLHKFVKVADRFLAFVEGLERVRLTEFSQLSPFILAQITPIPEAIPPKNSEVDALRRNALTLFRQIVAGSPTLSDEVSKVAMSIEEPGRLANFIASMPMFSTAVKQDLLETTDVCIRLEKISRDLAKELESQQPGSGSV